MQKADVSGTGSAEAVRQRPRPTSKGELYRHYVRAAFAMRDAAMRRAWLDRTRCVGAHFSAILDEFYDVVYTFEGEIAEDLLAVQSEHAGLVDRWRARLGNPPDPHPDLDPIEPAVFQAYAETGGAKLAARPMPTGSQPLSERERLALGCLSIELQAMAAIRAADDPTRSHEDHRRDLLAYLGGAGR